MAGTVGVVRGIQFFLISTFFGQNLSSFGLKSVEKRVEKSFDKGSDMSFSADVESYLGN